MEHSGLFAALGLGAATARQFDPLNVCFREIRPSVQGR
jgi:hypothetical protein